MGCTESVPQHGSALPCIVSYSGMYRERTTAWQRPPILQYCSIQAEALTTLLDNLCHLTSLKELNLSHIGTVAAQQLCRSLSQLSQLEKLRLVKCNIDPTTEDAIKRVTDNLPRLKFFRLWR
ncbi:hypothetical protein LSAT2_025263 [Lamellibrachia satsuma]|nr:hypothetical protein LSAT2_025263 [Lamellibrachia satsuma]